MAIEKAPGVSANTVRITSTATALGSSTAINRVTIFNRATYEIFVGGSTVTKGGGYLLNPGASTTGNTVTIETNNLSSVYIIGTDETSGNLGKVSYLIETK